MMNDEELAKELTKQAMNWLNNKLMDQIEKDEDKVKEDKKKHNRKKYEEKHGSVKKRKERRKFNRYMKTKNYEMRRAVLKRLGGKCVQCSYKRNWRALQIDHIDGLLGKERKRECGYSYYRRLLKISDEELFSTYQCLCANCNMIKRYIKREFRGAPKKLK